MTDLEFMQLELDAATKAQSAAVANKALQDANFAKAQVQVNSRIAELQAKIAELTVVVP